jgi:hypothetical protein
MMTPLFVLLAGVFLPLVDVDAAVIINEIMYHHAANEMFEYIELFNSDAAVAASVSGWRLKIGA